MRDLSDTISRLADFRSSTDHGREAAAGQLVPFPFPQSNPGALQAKVYVPAGLTTPAPLVVVLHGCTQSADGYDRGSGWSTLADRAGFALLFPEQRRVNNANLCFNWFDAQDNRRDRGELQSIREMIDEVIARHPIDPSRVFVTGLSAGGAITSALLCAYPEIFAGGAVIAGVAAGSANSMSEAFDRMRGHGGPDDTALASYARAQSDHHGRWPTLSVWHGSADHTVAPANMERLVGQWKDLAGLATALPENDIMAGHARRRWRDDAGSVRLEAVTVAGLGHGTPIAPREDGLGAAQPYMIDAGISSTARIAAFWGISDAVSAIPHESEHPASPVSTMQAAASIVSATSGVRGRIEDALRGAGLMR